MTYSVSAAGPSPAPAPAAPSTVSGLGEDAFMQLLITELQHQDPTQPQDDSQLLAQLAQFSSLEKLTSIDQSLTAIKQVFTAVQKGTA